MAHKLFIKFSNTLFIYSIFAITFFGYLNNANAQISLGGKPPSFINKLADKTVDNRVIQSPNLKQAILEDSNKPGPLWAGKSIPVGLNINNSGSWTSLADGSKIWRLQLNSPGAKAISVCYDNFYIPEGGKLFLYNAAKTQVLGAYTKANNPVNKIFSTEIVQGESVTLEYFEAANTLTRPVISISEIVHIYRTVPFVEQYNLQKSAQFGSSLECEVNVNCTEGTNWQKQKRGVAEIFLKIGTSWGWCSGDLINTTNNNGIPYLITADHCHSEAGSTASASDMLQWQFYFNYESPDCANPSTEPSYNTLTGCVLKSSSPINGGSDFCLVLLNNAPPESYNPYYNGWDHTDVAPTRGAGIHHPQADIKKISTYNSTLTSDYWYDGTNIGVADAHWVGNFVTTTNGYGQTEPGSSGSALFNQNNLQIGTCTGGTAASCASGSYFYYGKIAYHWDKMGASSSQQLKPWLDPLGTNPDKINGFDPYLVAPIANFTANTLNCNGSVQFSDISFNNPLSWNWDFGDGYKSNERNPNHSYSSNGAYDITLIVSNNSGTNTLKKTSFVTINFPSNPTTTNASRCGSGSVSLQAAGTGTLTWYDTQSGGNIVNTGTSFNTPNLTSNKTYYVQSEIRKTIQSSGMKAKTATGAYYYGTNYNGKWALTFDVFAPLKLISVMVYANSTASRTIWLKNSNGEEIDSLIVNIASGQQTVTLNFDIPVGSGYQLGTNGQNNLWRDQGMGVFPYTVTDLISITGNTSSSASNYYYFYNWQVQESPCTSGRTAVTAIIGNPVVSSIYISSIPSEDICKGTSVTFTANQTNGGYIPSYQWNINGINAGINSSKFSCSTLTNRDVVTCELISNLQCVSVSPVLSNDITMSVNDPPNAPIAATVTSTDTQINWNWTSVTNAIGYKWNTSDNINTATDNGLNTSLTQTGLTANTSFTIYIWAYNGCGNSEVISIIKSTLAGNKYSLSGKISYDNNSGTPLNNVYISLETIEGALIDSAITQADGTYTIKNLSAGKYITKCKTSEAASGFTPIDALEVSKFFVMTYKFSDNLKQQAADVDNSKNITPTDALLISKRFIKLINTFRSGDWLFENDTINIVDKDETLNIKALNYGDVDASKYSK